MLIPHRRSLVLLFVVALAIGVPGSQAQSPQALEALHQLLLPLFELAGVVFTDADETSDRLVVGTVTRTCVNTSVSGSDIVLLCQDFVENTVQIINSGDSGSPVFRINAGDSVTLLGNLWGGNSSGTLFVYSPIANIERELGALTTF